MSELDSSKSLFHMKIGGDFEPLLFNMNSNYKSISDQPQAIEALVNGFKESNNSRLY